MPATSKKQRRMMAIAEHHPSKLFARNRGVLGMTAGQMHDFAATKEKGLPSRSGFGKALMKHKSKRKRRRAA